MPDTAGTSTGAGRSRPDGRAPWLPAPDTVRRTAAVGLGAAVAVLVGVDGSPGWQVARVAAVAAWTVLVVVVVERDGWGTPLGAATGAVGLAVTVGFAPHLLRGGLTTTSAATAVLGVSSVVLLVSSTRSLLRGRRLPWRLVGWAAALLGSVLAVLVVAPAVLATNVAPTELGETPEGRGLRALDVTITTADGVDLAGWYVPSTDGAAVVLRHGAGSTRSDVLDQAEVLARHGYGVLMLDARGHGASGGRAMDFGWYGDADIAAGTSFLAQRADVEPGRIGLVGMSMGGEEAIGAAGSDPRVRAVVAEGATARTASDKDWLSDEHGVRGALQEQIERLQYGLTDLLTSASPPRSLRGAVEASDARFLLVAAGEVADETASARHIASGAPDRVEVWTVPGASHTGGLATAPQEWARRVVGFLDAHL